MKFFFRIQVYVLVFVLFSCGSKGDYFLSANKALIECHGSDYSIGNIVDSVGFRSDSSVGVSEKSPYGLTLDIEDLKAGELVSASVFVRDNNNSNIGLVADGNWKTHYVKSREGTISVGAWRQLSIRVRVPEHISNGKIRFYVHNEAKQLAFADELEVKLEKSNESLELPQYVFFAFLYDLIDDYHIRYFKPIPYDSIVVYAGSDQMIELMDKQTILPKEFHITWQKLQEELGGEERFWEWMKREAKKRSTATVSFVAEDNMKEVRPSGYVRNMFCFPLDTAVFIIEGKELLSEISLFKVGKNYKIKKIEEIDWFWKKAKLLIPCENLRSGVYKLELKGKHTFEIPLVIVDKDPKPVVVIAPFSTWHAYNSYGGKSFYRNGIDSQNVYSLSTHRPLNSICFEPKNKGHDIGMLAHTFEWFNEQWGARILPDYWLENRQEAFMESKTLVLAHHCEYFSPKMMSNFIKITKDRNILSLGGNQLYWKVKWNKEYDEIFCRKDGSFYKDSDEPGGLWRNGLISEARILGNAFDTKGYKTFAPYEVLNESHQLFRNTHVKNGQLFGQKGAHGQAICGGETDKVSKYSPKNIEILAKGVNPNQGGGDIVFLKRKNVATLSFGSIVSAGGLGVDSVFTQVIDNFMQDFK
ncbi:MAG: hypothetical protein N4A45_10985 [Flavobacteriales bacterium]|jgi:hypothetical protein|nr:hypothetical protein [Flavobacteriales bacterium]